MKISVLRSGIAFNLALLHVHPLSKCNVRGIESNRKDSFGAELVFLAGLRTGAVAFCILQSGGGAREGRYSPGC